MILSEIRLPKVSILVVNYNGKTHLEEFMNSVLNLNYPKDKLEIVIVDNGSSDNSPLFIKQKYSHIKQPKIKVIELGRNYGFAKGNNIGAKYCEGEFLALVNNDTIVDKDWLIELIKQAIKNPNAIYGSKMLWYYMKKKKNIDIIIYHGGSILSWGWPQHFRLYDIDKSIVEPDIIETFYADGCGLLISKDLFFKIGGFDETYFAYAEDYELSWKARLHGYNVYFIPTAKFYHKVGSTGGVHSYFHIYHLWRNNLRNLFKFTEFPTLVKMLPLFTLYTIFYYLIIYVLIEKLPKIFFPMARAYKDVLFDLKRIIRLRKYYQSIRKISDKELKKRKLILSFGKSLKESYLALKRRQKIAKVS